jgi:regulation of enolase protein 1 (concanavalin A-like superfamily)
MDLRRSLRQGASLALLVLCLAVSSRAAAQTPTSGWNSLDVGGGVPGGTNPATDGFSVWGAGDDIWNQSDNFRFVYRELDGDGVITTRLSDFAAPDTWSKAGLMIRETLYDSSKHASIFRSGSQGLAFQHRADTNGWSVNDAGSSSSAAWMKLERRGSTVIGSYSHDGVTWTSLGQVNVGMNTSVYIGLALTSHANTYAGVSFNNVSVSNASGGGAWSPASSSWTSADVGSPQLAGSTSPYGDGLAVTAGGADVWGTSDQFRFAYQQMSGDGSIVALVRGLSAADAWSKAGVMIRDTMSANSAHAFMLLSGSEGLAFQRRRTAGGSSSHTAGPLVGGPIWVRLQRSGSTITASYSWDSVNWAIVGSDTISMGSTVYVGFALSSRSSVAYSTAYFTNPSIESNGGSGGGSSLTPGNQAPQVSLTSPVSGSTFGAPATFTLTATASDSDGGVAVVEFYSGSYLLGADITSPYSVTLYGIPSGTYSFTAVARDWSGAITVSSERVVYVGSASRAAEAVFTPSPNQDSTVSHYVLNIFYVGADPYASNPIASVNLGLPPIVNGEARADIAAAVSALSPGNYFATVTAVGYGGEATSTPSSAFSR